MEQLAGMTVGELIGWIIGALLALSTIIQISPIKINPWSTIAKSIGKAINGELIAKVDKLDNDLTALKNSTDERNAKLLRNHILKFGDELLHDVRHSKENFDQILQDITEYEQYCDEHPLFKNDMTRITTKHIKETYQKCIDEHSFL